MRSQQDFSKCSCSCWCPPLHSFSFFVPLGLLLRYPSTSLVVFLCILFPPLVHIALLQVYMQFISFHPLLPASLPVSTPNTLHHSHLTVCLAVCLPFPLTLTILPTHPPFFFF